MKWELIKIVTLVILQNIKDKIIQFVKAIFGNLTFNGYLILFVYYFLIFAINVFEYTTWSKIFIDTFIYGTIRLFFIILVGSFLAGCFRYIVDTYNKEKRKKEFEAELSKKKNELSEKFDLFFTKFPELKNNKIFFYVDDFFQLINYDSDIDLFVQHRISLIIYCIKFSDLPNKRKVKNEFTKIFGVKQ